MSVTSQIAIFLAMLLVAILTEPLARRLRLPFAAMLVLVGFLGSEVAVRSGLDLGLRWEDYNQIILFILLPVLIFEAALNMDARLLARNLFPVLVLAIPTMLLSAGLTAVLVFIGIARPSGFPWIAALLTGAILAATDPAAVLDLFKQTHAPRRLTVLMDGESLLNDAAAIVLFMVLLGAALSGSVVLSWSDAAIRFGVIFLGGIATGAIVGGFAALLFNAIRGGIVRGAASLISAYLAFAVAEWLQVSGVMSVLIAGLAIGWVSRRAASEAQDSFHERLWAFNAYLANAVIFMLVGISVTVEMFTERWLAMLIGIGAVLVARALSIYVLMPLINRVPGVEPIGLRYQHILFWGGLRGAVAVALALSLPLQIDYWWTVQSIAYGVVLFSLLVQAPTMPLLLRRYVSN